jgi:hypothetical protein
MFAEVKDGILDRPRTESGQCETRVKGDAITMRRSILASVKAVETALKD